MNFSVFNQLFQNSKISGLSSTIFRKKAGAGFTLIELLITVAIGSLVLGGGIATYNNFDRKQKIQSAGRDLVLSMRSAQKRADSGDKPSGCVNFQAWAVRRVTTTSYETAVVCGGVYSVVSTKNLPSGTILNTNFDIRFMALTGGTIGATTIDVIDDDAGDLYQISITSAGAVDDKGFQ